MTTREKIIEGISIASALINDRLDLIRQRELDERDGVEEGRLKSAAKILHTLWKAATADLLEEVVARVQMSREEKIDLMINKDLQSIEESILVGDYTFLTAVLSGEGFTPYNKLSDQEIEEEYGEMNRKKTK